ncbi:MAG: RNA polymerase sigma factor [Planctomycetes bacterium]|nr:RNA polymerase sigma factor [Planctomycetota bacterium]
MEDFDAHRAELRRLAQRLVQDTHAVEDVLQEARLAIWRAPARDPEHARSWYRAIVRNQSLIARRRRNAARHRDAQGQSEQLDVDPAEACARSSALEAVRRSVEQLAEPYRSVIALRHLEGFTVAEVSALLARPEGTVRSQTKRGLALLRRRLESLLREAGYLDGHG